MTGFQKTQFHRREDAKEQFRKQLSYMTSLDHIQSVLQDEIIEKSPAHMKPKKTAVITTSFSDEGVDIDSSPLNVKKVHTKVNTSKFFKINPVGSGGLEDFFS